MRYLVFSLLFALCGAQARAQDEGQKPSVPVRPALRETRYLVSLHGAAALTIRGELPEETRAINPAFGGMFGVRWGGDYELHLEFSHAEIGAARPEPWDVGGLTHFGLAFNYSPASFYGGYFQGRAGWLTGEVSPTRDLSRLYVGAGYGYSWVLGRLVDLRAFGGLQISPVETLAGRQTWPIATVGLQLAFKMETMAEFFLSVLGRPASPF